MEAQLLPAVYRYARHLPLGMLVGKARHAFAGRFFVPFALKATPPPNYDWVFAFTNTQVTAFAEAFQIMGNRFSPTCDRLHVGEFVSNGCSHSFGSPSAVRWGTALTDPKYIRWQHDLAYFLFAIPLISRDPDRGISTIASMVRALEGQLGRDPSELQAFHWSPIAVAVRTLAITTAISLAPQATLKAHPYAVATLGGHIWRSTEMLKLMVERYLGFNHAATTETGLAVGLLVQGKTDAAARSISNLVRTFDRSILDDGMWAERSPSYHVHMLLLLDAVKSMPINNSPERLRLEEMSNRMRFALAAIVHPDGEIAIFNDSAEADSPPPSAVGWSLAEAPDTIVLPNAGYARFSRAGTVVIMDAGPMGPDAVIGHGHADFLSIELSIGHNRLIVDPGVASVSPGPDRVWTRSASSHNGPTLTGREPAEFFGVWRVGRRGTARFDDFKTNVAGTVSLAGECDGYMPWGVIVRRKLVLESNGRITIEDTWIGATDRSAVVSLLVPDDWGVELDSATRVTMKHIDGSVAVLSVSCGEVSDIVMSRYFRKGPMQEQRATRLIITPRDDYVATTIEPMNGL